MPLIVFAAFLALLFGPTLAAGRLALIGDPLKEFYPIRTVAWQAIRHGHLPVWTPYLFSGYPLSSAVMVGFGYPLTWGYLILPGQWAEQIYVLAPYALAPLFTYAFLRECGRGRTAAIAGALTFTYGGFLFSPIGLTGVHANSAMWVPLLLLAIARVRRRPFVESLLLATAAYAMSMLAGSGQIFLYGGALALAYSIFLAVFPLPAEETAVPRRWQPLAITAGAIVLAAGLTAFQTLQTRVAVSQSVRQAYPLARVEEGSFTPALAWHSLVQPLGNFWDSSTYVPLLALLVAAAGICAGRRRPQVWFWTAVAAISWVLILGKYSPLFEVYLRLPFVRLFRYPSRHSMEWSLAIAVLASYGWDFIESAFARGPDDSTDRKWIVWPAASAGVFVVLAAIAAWRWKQLTIRTQLDQVGDINFDISGLNPGYLAWKAAFTLCIVAALVLLWRMTESPLRRGGLVFVVAAACFVEPYLWVVRPAIETFSVPRAMFGTFGKATQALLKEHPTDVRTFSVAHPYSENSTPVRDVDPVNWTALAGMEDANGYESLILARYDLAFRGNAESEPFLWPDPTILGDDSRLLDVLNVGYVIAFRPFSPVRTPTVEKNGVAFSTDDFGVDVKREHPYSISAAGAPIDAVALVTTLGGAGLVPQDTPVARMTLHAADGRVVTRDLRAGVDTAEMAYDRSDARGSVRHRRATMFDDFSSDPTSHRYFASIGLESPLPVTRIDFLKLTDQAGVGLWKVSVHEAASRTWAPLPQPQPGRWQTVYDRDGVMVIRNLHAQPRAWLAPNVVTLDPAEVLRRIRGESSAAFDPRTTALLEKPEARAVAAAEAYARTAGTAPLSAGDSVAIHRRDAARIVLETTASRPAMLVVSEINYPGWVARLDGTVVPIHTADFLLRGVFVPAGRHTVVMAYHPPGARRGIIVSLATLLLITGVGIIERRSRRA